MEDPRRATRFGAAAVAPVGGPAIQALYEDPCTPFWAKDLIAVLRSKDSVDRANVLDVLAAAYAADLRS